MPRKIVKISYSIVHIFHNYLFFLIRDTSSEITPLHSSVISISIITDRAFGMIIVTFSDKYDIMPGVLFFSGNIDTYRVHCSV